MTSEIVISSEPKFAKFGKRSQLQSIGDQLSLLVYDGKLNMGINGILGQAQTVKKNKFKGKSIRVQISSELREDPECRELYLYIQNIVRHVKSKDVDIRII